MFPADYEIRALVLGDAAALAAAYRRNQAHLKPWDPSRDPSFNTDEGQSASIAGQLASVEAGHQGASGRFERIRETALSYAFAVSCGGLA